MTKEEYFATAQKIKKSYQDAINKLGVEYVESNNPYKIGDIISDNVDTIKIQRIEIMLPLFRAPTDVPECRYYGVQLKKNGSPKKRQDPTISIFQTSIKNHKVK